MVSKHHSTQIGLHSVRNILGESSQLSLFSEHDQKFSNEFSIKLSGKLDRFGIDLTEIQSRVMEGILRGFSETKYQGNALPKNKEDVILDKYSGRQPDSFKNIVNLPCLKTTQAQILDWAGISRNHISSWARAVEALQELGSKQYCFYYDRLVFDENGTPQREANGRWKKEEVVTVDTLFLIKEIRDEQNGDLKYYEIIPSPIFLDQRESYFMLIPFGWREEVQQLVGKKKASSYTFRFLLFLRYQYELMRRSPYRQQSGPFQIKLSPEDVAIAIKMPESIYQRKKKRMNEILEDGYTVAKKLGYLTEFERKDYLDILTLNDQKYFNPKDMELSKSIEAMGESKQKTDEATKLLDLFYSCRKTLDPQTPTPSGSEKVTFIKIFVELLKNRPYEDIEMIIKWSVTHKYWGSKLSNPKNLNIHFSEARAEFSLSNKSEHHFERNKKYANEVLSKYENISFDHGTKIAVCSKYIEIVGTGQAPSNIINYDDKDFLSKIKSRLQLMKVEGF